MEIPTKVPVFESVAVVEALAPEAPAPEAAPKKRRISAYRRPDLTPREHLTAKARLEQKKRRVVARLLDSEEELPVHYLMEELHTYAKKARTLEKVSENEMSQGTAEEILLYRDKAHDAAVAAAPYLHAKLAPLLQKGEKGLQVSLIIEDA